ncbi:MAG: TnpV protein [Adlercreutzia equolifaciens]
MLPTLATEEEAAANLGPFALMRDEYLRSSKPELRADLLAQGALARHLAETEARRRRWRTTWRPAWRRAGGWTKRRRWRIRQRGRRRWPRRRQRPAKRRR